MVEACRLIARVDGTKAAHGGRAVGMVGLVHDVDHGADPHAINGDPQRLLPVEVRPPFAAVRCQLVLRLNPPDENRHLEALFPLNGSDRAVPASPKPKRQFLSSAEPTTSAVGQRCFIWSKLRLEPYAI